MKPSLKNTIIFFFQSIDKAVFDVYQTTKRINRFKLPHWLSFVVILLLYLFILQQLIVPLLFASEYPFFYYFGIVFFIILTILFLVVLKFYLAQLLQYKNPTPILISNGNVQKLDAQEITELPFRFTDATKFIDYENSNLFQRYLQQNPEDFQKLIDGLPIANKIKWSARTDKKLPNFRLLFELMNYLVIENLEGYYGENLLQLCIYINNNFASDDSDFTIKQLQKAHSGWKNCNPKRRLDLKLDIQNSLAYKNTK